MSTPTSSTEAELIAGGQLPYTHPDGRADRPRHVTELLDALPDAATTHPPVLARLSGDSSRAIPRGQPLVAVQARSTQDVQIALAWATRWRVPVSVRGAGTGLAGGAVAYADGMVLSLTRMDRILEIDPPNRLIRVEPGVITADVDRAAAEHGLMYAPDPASHRESTIGGNIATNAGGLRCVRYGVTTDSVAALQVVLADGRVIRTGSRTRKNVVGYDLTRLFTGSEGTLGVVTEATLRLIPRPQGKPATVRAVFGTLPAAGRAVTSIMTGTVIPEIMELMDQASVEIVEQYEPTGLGQLGAAVLIIQTSGPSAHPDAEVLSKLCRRAGADHVELAAGDVLLAARRVSGRALNARGLRASCDVAVPIDRLADMFAAIEEISREEHLTIPTFAHAGDGNLHPSVLIHEETPAAMAEAERILHRITTAALQLGGTISGEHGVGSLKLPVVPEQLDDDTLAAHRLIKAALDPLGILSPGRAV
jgi:glycolate oxidase